MIGRSGGSNSANRNINGDRGGITVDAVGVATPLTSPGAMFPP